MNIEAKRIGRDVYTILSIFTIHRNNSGLTVKRLYRDGILQKLHELGFWKSTRDNGECFFIKAEDNIIAPTSIPQLHDAIQEIINSLSDVTCIIDQQTYEIKKEELREIFFAQQHLVFNESFLLGLKTHATPILHDTQREAYFLFRNGVVVATKSGAQCIRYSALNACVWRSHIIEHNIKFDPGVIKSLGCHFGRFLQNVMGNDVKSLLSGMGYALHNYNTPTVRKAFILNDAALTTSRVPQGGTGKGLILQALSKIRETVSLDGKRFSPEDKFRWQRVEDSTQILVIDDLREGIPFSVFHSAITEGLDVEKKGMEAFKLPPLQSPKMVLSSNNALDGEGNTNRRRQFVIELGDFYVRMAAETDEPIKKHHGCIFFSDEWKKAEWDRFYSLMIGCVSLYLKKGLIHPKRSNLKTNRLIQRTSHEFALFIASKSLKLNDRHDTTVLYEEFKAMYRPDDNTFIQRNFTDWLKRYAEINDWELEISRSNGHGYFTIKSR